MNRNDQSHDRMGNLLVWIVPLGVLISTAIFPLQQFVRQALIGIMLIWIYLWFISSFRIGP